MNTAEVESEINKEPNIRLGEEIADCQKILGYLATMIDFNKHNKPRSGGSFNLTDIQNMQKYIRDKKYVRLKEKDELIEKIAGIKEKLIESSWSLACANVKLAKNLAKKYRNRTVSSGVDLKDFVHEGLFALFYAALGFNPKINPDFENYATKRVRQALRLAMAGSSTIKLPTNLVGNMGRFFKTNNDLFQTLCRPPHPEEIAKRANLPLEDVKILVMWSQGMLYLDAPIKYKRSPSNGDDNKTLIEFVAAPAVETRIDNKDGLQIDIRIQIKEALKKVSPIERKILRCYFLRGIPYQKIAKKMYLRRKWVKETLAKFQSNSTLPFKSA